MTSCLKGFLCSGVSIACEYFSCLLMVKGSQSSAISTLPLPAPHEPQKGTCKYRACYQHGLSGSYTNNVHGDDGLLSFYGPFISHVAFTTIIMQHEASSLFFTTQKTSYSFAAYLISKLHQRCVPSHVLNRGSVFE